MTILAPPARAAKESRGADDALRRVLVDAIADEPPDASAAPPRDHAKPRDERLTALLVALFTEGADR